MRYLKEIICKRCMIFFSILNHSQSQPADASFKSFFQAKPGINQSNDVYEQEADNVAEQVMRTSSAHQTFFSPSAIQRKEDSNQIISSAQTENYIASVPGGNPLRNEERSFFESRMGNDFSNVRIHTDNNANQSAKNINALAYTYGNDIVFAKNQYQPNTEEGKKLIAHELTHVMQQNNNPSKQIQAKRELDAVTEKDQYTKCLSAIDNVIKKLEENAQMAGMPDDIKEAVKLLRKKFSENKIKCYYLDGNERGVTNFTTGEIYMDAKTLQDMPGTFANIGEGNVLHEGIHALHNVKYPASTKKYGKVLDDKHAGKPNTLTEAEQQSLEKLDAWTEYYGLIEKCENIVT